MATQISYQDCGTNWAVFIRGDSTEQIEHRFFSFWNWKATGGELEWLTDDLARFWTTRHKLTKYFENISLMELIDTRASDFKGKQFGALPEAKRIAQEKLDALVKERILSFGATLDCYSYGKASAEKPDLDLKDYFISRSFSV